MRALLLAAGLGTRLRPITDHMSKCLVPIHGRPLLAYWLEPLFTSGIERVLINTHWFSEQVITFVESSPWRNQIELVYEPELLGTGGTILANKSWFGDSDFIVAHADNLTDFDIPVFLSAHQHRPSYCEMTMLSFVTDTPQSCGILELNEAGIVQSFHEKVASPPGNLANGAVYVFSPQIWPRLMSLNKQIIDLSTEIIPQMCKRILAVNLARYHRDIGTPESLHLAEQEFQPNSANV